MQLTHAVCSVCSGPFSYERLGKKPRTICSPECKRRKKNGARSQGLRGPAVATCAHCGVTFEYMRRSRERLYCSKRCKDQYTPRLVEVIKNCLVCGVEFAYISTPGRQRTLCSDECVQRRRIIIRVTYYQQNAEAMRRKASEWAKANTDRNRARAREWSLANPERARESKAAYAKRNAERVREIKRRYALRNPEVSRLTQQRRRARLRSATIVPFSAEQVRQRMSMFAGCWICGDPDAWHMDHVKPLAAGGPHVLANLRKICAPCNSSKGGRWPFSA